MRCNYYIILLLTVIAIVFRNAQVTELVLRFIGWGAVLNLAFITIIGYFFGGGSTKILLAAINSSLKKEW